MVRFTTTTNNKTMDCIDCGNRFSFLTEGYRCKDCKKIKTAILECKADPDSIKPGFVIEVNYDVHRQSHSGYCSDPYDFTSEDDEETYTYPVWKGLTNRDIDRQGKVTSDMKHMYDRPTKWHGGNGFCGRGTTYKIKSAHVMKEQRVVDLDD